MEWHEYTGLFNCRVRGEHDQTIRQQKQVSEQLEQQSAQSCIPDPDPSGKNIKNEEESFVRYSRKLTLFLLIMGQ